MRIILMMALSLCLALGSCAALQKLAQTEVPMKAIIVAGNAVDGAETAATAYVRLCTPTPAPKGCNDSLIKNTLWPAVLKVRVARNAAEQFALDNPDAKLGPATLIDAVTTAVGALQQIVSTNAIKS
jgi:hypothetical protein